MLPAGPAGPGANRKMAGSTTPWGQSGDSLATLSQISTWRILRKDLGLHPYKIQMTQELKQNDHSLRRRFADWALEQLEVNANFGKKIIFSDEAHF